ncbi:hypothetical protein GALMADRAFT_215389 [Galerina marginata CBS 339.88]|uniref:Uncharacterized protein n=1 Tax=Galerina marginata (strain CBS 339.88) TaxID=685588 RepID=A0A067SDW9_GALM3|nr:hypothetical protein GALMADRAFT_215389 [Galerina marginata CBS 339.88]
MVESGTIRGGGRESGRPAAQAFAGAVHRRAPEPTVKRRPQLQSIASAAAADESDIDDDVAGSDDVGGDEGGGMVMASSGDSNIRTPIRPIHLDPTSKTSLLKIALQIPPSRSISCSAAPREPDRGQTRDSSSLPAHRPRCMPLSCIFADVLSVSCKLGRKDSLCAWCSSTSRVLRRVAGGGAGVSLRKAEESRPAKEFSDVTPVADHSHDGGHDTKDIKGEAHWWC